MRNRISPLQIKIHSGLRKLGLQRDPEFIPVFFFARSGSTVHGATLNTHSNSISLNEAFEHYADREGNLFRTSMFRKKLDEVLAHYENQRLPLTRPNIIDLIKQHREFQRAQRGKYLTHCFFQFNHFYFPIFQNKLDFEAFFSFIGQHFPGMVIINRKNSLLRLVSIMRAQQFNIWHSNSNSPKEINQQTLYLNPNIPINTYLLSANNLLDYLEKIQEVENNIIQSAKKYNHRLLHLVYEDDIDPDPMIGVEKVIEFFDLPQSAKPLQVPIQKTSHGLKHDLTNFSEIEALLKGTPFAWMLY